ncbi:alpha/beta hydrolase [Ramlibacter sp. G-1-2-2]|uniref:Alpha/beta hydrolase n=1 Tax=Ramlibacter agri TaxID=2728837 RepID=A0A848HA79_9BURK|nr:alpha/beta hydrolase [Ramlibacter agri]NML47394.1 alpha/beta hydrolase [Ramlibacter agri]
MSFIRGFATHQVRVQDDVTLHCEIGGNGPPLLLLHGYPQTHAAWHKVAPRLAQDFTVVAPDLRGWGDSSGPPGDPLQENHCKRAHAADQARLMRHFGFERFALIGHDRGGRVAHRLCLDHPDAVSAFVSVTVLPTEWVWQRVDTAFSLKAWHWFMLAQPYDLPERLLAADPESFLDSTLRGMVRRFDAVTPEARAQYLAAFLRPGVRHAMIQDYRAAAGIDRVHDRASQAAGQRVRAPLLVLWDEALFGAAPATPVEAWQPWADRVEAAALPCGHLMMEEAPGPFLDAVLPFLLSHAQPRRSLA